MIPSEYVKDGFVLGDDKTPGMNDWLITGVAVALNIYEPSPLEAKAMFDLCRKSPDCPLIYRGPNKKNSDDTEKADDYWAALLIAAKHNKAWALELLAWAEANSWTFNVQDPESLEPEYRFDRFICFSPLLRIAAGQKLNISDMLILMVGLIFDCFSLSSPDGNAIALCKMAIVERYSPLFFPFTLLWRNRIKKKFSNRIAFSIAGGIHVGYGHPIVTSGV